MSDPVHFTTYDFREREAGEMVTFKLDHRPSQSPVPPPVGADEKLYALGGIWSPEILVALPDPPPCIWCDTPVTSPSCDGPLVCGWCDMGKNRDGTEWSAEDYKRLSTNKTRKVAGWVEAQAARQASTASEGRKP